MHKILLAIGFCLAVPAALAGTVEEQTPKGPREGLMHATLVVPAHAAKPRPAEPAVVKAALQAEQEAPPSAAEDGGPGHGMLLAALALMVGIVLRRWGGGRS